MSDALKDNRNASNPLLSIIIPCFNSEQYIFEALNSTLQVNLISIELIIINDGSTDNTVEQIENFISLNSNQLNIKLFHQTNQGVSAARNLGIKNANGIYIGFLDADDIFLNGFDSLIAPIIKDKDLDIIEFGFKQFYDDENIGEITHHPLYKYKGGYQITNIIDDIHAKTVWYSPIRIYKRALWEGIKYPLKVKFSEDSMTLPKVFQAATSIFYINKPLYGYRQNPQSASSNHSVKHLSDLIDFYWSIDQKDRGSRISKISKI